MAVPLIPISPEQMAEGRRLYEQTRMPVADIAAMLGIAATTLYERSRAWGWRRRINRIPREDPDRASDEPAPGEVTTANAAIAARIERLVEHELTAIETIIAGHAPDDERTEKVERSARVLASLSRTLQEVKRLDAKATPRKDDNDRPPDDPDEFAQDLVRRMDEFARRHQASLRDEPAAEVP